MAYPSVEAPYGFVPVNLIGGQVFAGSTRLIPIASGSATAIFYGNVVKLINTGTIENETATVSSTSVVGVFLGCTYTDATYGKVFRQYYPGGVTASDIEAYVADDPDTLFKVAITSAGTSTIAYVTRSAVGNNTALITTAGSTVTGNSRMSISATTVTTTTSPVRIIDVVKETAKADDPSSFCEVIVKWNQGFHQYLNATGV